MDIARELYEIPTDHSAGSCVTIGNFDGVHKGHQQLIGGVAHRARARGLKSVVVTFDPHPLRVLVGPNTPPFITSLEQRLDLIADLGVDLTLLLTFTRELAALAPRQFVSTYLVDWLNTKDLMVGYDYSFGKGRKGNYEVLKELGAELGFGVERLDPVIINDAVVSSTRIRDMVKAGDLWGVKPIMGRFYAIRGTVVQGRDRGGRLLGFPTANVAVSNELVPAGGVYAAWIHAANRVYPAVVNVGYNPTFGNDKISVEAHILNFGQEIYDQRVRLHFVQRLRAEKKFNGIDELKTQIGRDVELARQILATPEAQL